MTLHRLVTVLILLFAVPRLSSAAGDAANGRNVFALAGGCGCHTMKDGPIGAGGGEIVTPFGKFFATNITPDDETGLGQWSDLEIEKAIRGGDLRGRGVEAPVMPYYLYAGMADDDVVDLIAYLRTLPPARRANQPHQGELPLARLAYRAWRLLLAPVAPHLAVAPVVGIDRGRYLVDHVSICGDCHTPRNRLGVPIAGMYLAGTNDGPGGEAVPNLTPHKSGLAEWDDADIVSLLRQGVLPNFDNVQGLMAEVIDGKAGGAGYKDAPADAVQDMATYLQSVRAIDNEVTGK